MCTVTAVIYLPTWSSGCHYDSELLDNKMPHMNIMNKV